MKKLLLFLLLLLSAFFVNAQKEFWGVGSGSSAIYPGYEEYSNPFGWIYKTDSNGENIQIVHQFDTLLSPGRAPSSSLALASDGNLYGTTSLEGEIYKYDLAADSFSVVAQLGSYVSQGTVPNLPDKLIEVQPGILMGTASSYVFAYNFYTDSLYEILRTPFYWRNDGYNQVKSYPNLHNLFSRSLKRL